MSLWGARPSATTTTTTTSNNQETNVELVEPPSDSISCIAFSPAAQGEYLAVGAWDNTVRIYEIGPQGQSQGKAMYSHEGPVLDLCWSADGSRLFSCGADKAARMFDLSTNGNNGQAVQIGAHDAPIRCVRWIESPGGGILATGSWDKSIKYWDLKSPNPVASVQTQDRVYCMDVRYPLLVVGTAERHIQIINLNQPTSIHKTISSPLKWQTRTISCFPSATGFCVGSVEGRVAVQWLDEKDTSSNYSFRCHRQEQTPGNKDVQLVFPVNATTYHDQHGTFATSGGDGVINIWDLDSKTRIKTFNKQPAPITAISFNKSGSLMAYAIAYDWEKGYSGMVTGHPNKVLIHLLKEEETKKKPRR